MTNEQARHVAFEVGTRDLLSSVYRRARERGVPIPYARDTGCALSLYIRDPDQNVVEIYWATGKPRRDRLPISNDAEIRALLTGYSRGGRAVKRPSDLLPALDAVFASSGELPAAG